MSRPPLIYELMRMVGACSIKLRVLGNAALDFTARLMCTDIC